MSVILILFAKITVPIAKYKGLVKEVVEKILKDRIEDSLTFDDVLLLPGRSIVLPSEV